MGQLWTSQYSPFLSNIFGRLFGRQLLEFFDNILSKFQRGFRKGYGTQHILLLTLEIWKELLTIIKLLLHYQLIFRMCLSHDLLIKSHTYSVEIDSLNILPGYIYNRKQRTKQDSFYSSWEAILSNLPQGSLYLDHFCSIYSCVTCS